MPLDIMGLFEEEGEYVDYTLLKKKGLIKARQDNLNKVKTDGGFIDFTSLGGNNTSNTNTSSNNPAVSSESNSAANSGVNSNFSFLADMAVGSDNGSASPVASTGFDNNLSNNIDGRELNGLKIKIDDIEYKLERFIERIDKLEEHLSRLGGQN